MIDKNLAHMDLMTVYKNSATIHGLSHTTNSPLYWWRRFLWLFLVGGMGTGLGVFVYLDMVDYFNFASTTVITAHAYSKLDFPAVTICNLNQFHRSRVPNDRDLIYLLYNLSEFNDFHVDIREDPVLVNLSSTKDKWTGENLSTFASFAAHRMDVMFWICYWKSRRIPCNEIFTRRLTDLGYCFSFNGNTTKTLQTGFTGPVNGLRVLMDIEQDEYFFSKTTQAGVKVLLHDVDAPPLMTNHGIFVQPGTSTFVGITIEKKSSLGPPYMECAHTDTSEFQSREHRYPGFKYSVDACWRECFVTELLEACGCRYFLEPGSERLCSLNEITQCYLPTLNGLMLTFDNNCYCQSPCKLITYQPTISTANFASMFITRLLYQRNITKSHDYLKDNFIDLRVYLDTLTVMEVEQKPKITVTAILGNLGGHMGLCLGASILSLTELFEFLILMATQRLQRGTKVDKEHDKNAIVMNDTN